SLNVPATPESPTLSLHDALPIFAARLCRDQDHAQLSACRHLQRVDHEVIRGSGTVELQCPDPAYDRLAKHRPAHQIERLGIEIADRKSTRLNSSHVKISYAVFCL